MTAAGIILLSRWTFFPRCMLPIDDIMHIEDRLLLNILTVSLCLPVSDVLLSPLFSFAPASRDIADAFDHENLSARIISNVEKNTSRCLL